MIKIKYNTNICSMSIFLQLSSLQMYEVVHTLKFIENMIFKGFDLLTIEF